jgi:hypothetical protein
MALNHFADCVGRAEGLRRLIDLENELSPREMSSIWQGRYALPEHIIAPLEKTIKTMARGARQPRAYGRTRISENANYYRAHRGTDSKTLLIAFCGNANRLMLPIPVFLQFVPEDSYDVLILRDPSRTGYLRGVPGFGDDLLKVAKTIRAKIDVASYCEVRCIGTSGGGAAALYTGLLLHARRAVSVGGRHRTVCKRVAEGDSEFTGDEFDVLLQGLGPTDTELFNIFGEHCERDIEGARSLEKYLGRLQPITVRDLAGHNVLAHLLQKGTLPNFFKRILFSGSVS